MIWLRQRLLNRMSMRPRLDHARGDVRGPARRPCTGGILTLGLIIGACLAGSAGAVAAAAAPRYDKAARGLYLRFLNAPKPGAATTILPCSVCPSGARRISYWWILARPASSSRRRVSRRWMPSRPGPVA